MTDAPTPPEQELDDAVEGPSGGAGQSNESSSEPLDADGQPVDTGVLDRAQDAIDEGQDAAHAALDENAPAADDFINEDDVIREEG